MKFQKGDVVRQVLPSGVVIGGLMVVTESTDNKRTVVRDVATGASYTYKSCNLEKVGETIKIMVSKEDMNRIDTTKGIGSFYHRISQAYDKLYANPSRFICFILADKGFTIRKIYQLGEISRVLRKVNEVHKGYQIVPVKQPM
jgi:hypothetical protein|nr:MAG TPA_asm: hypothetical protein [Caudoviricetes sp.]